MSLLWILIFVGIYFLSVFLMWLWIKISHSKGGIYSNLEPNGGDVFLTLFPVFNTVSALMCWSINPPKRINCNKFFRIKK